MGFLQLVDIAVPKSIHGEITGHGKGKTENDIVDLLKEEYRQYTIKDKEEFDPQVDVYGIDHAGHYRIKRKITETGQLILLMMGEGKHEEADKNRAAGDHPGISRHLFLIQQNDNGNSNPCRQTDKIHEIEYPELSFFVTTKGRLISNVFYIGLNKRDFFYSRVHGSEPWFYQSVQLFTAREIDLALIR
jgi:hypothetical protein